MSFSAKKKPLHQQIKEDLLKKIHSGDYKKNEIIPKEIDLAEQYHVSRPTVRQAVQSLVADGYLERKQRKGTIVKRNKINQEFTHIIESYDSEMKRKGLKPKTKVLTFKKENANLDICLNLNITEDEEVYKLVRLRYAETDPIVLVTTYLPVKMLPELLEINFSERKLYDALTELDFPITSIVRKLEVIKADETTSDLLDITEEDPIFYFHSVGYTNNRIPIEYSISKYRGDLNSFIFEVNNP